MTTNKAIESSAARDQANDEWLQLTPGERFRISVSSAQTKGAYSVMEFVAHHNNGVPLHIHGNEEEHFIVLGGTLDLAVGNRRWHVAAGSCATAKRGEPHAWRNPADTPLHMLVVFSPGSIDAMFRACAGVNDVDKIVAIVAPYGTQLTGPPLGESDYSIYSPREDSGL
ncbi:cupin domain-containing protein [Bradyrhizobium lablabi]|uniref:cupin domain-containing protein n=1 Tax=Bradyrhizobium lablabi TaxID=722472 RepID=UPI001BA4C68A|nr:cupin domain-containing protein [Bradyrhizobium lablabi]MBR0696941.1 cupin domain-containing protein [Bradyrhizobium lablabi]